MTVYMSHNGWKQLSIYLKVVGYLVSGETRQLLAALKIKKKQIQQRLADQFCQKWSAEIYQSNKCINYRIFKTTLKLENYLIDLPFNQRRLMTRFRCRNNKLPIEIGCRLGIDRNLRLCTLCKSDIGDEFRSHLDSKRLIYIKPYFVRSPSCFKFDSLMNNTDKTITTNLCKFVKIILACFP